MLLKPWSLLLCALAAVAVAHPLDEAARGLDVSLEHMVGETAINGISLDLSRATGPAVPLLVDRLVRRWQEEGGSASVRTLECCGWRLASRIHAGQSQVVQWRLGPVGAELLWSATDLLSEPQRSPGVTAPLPRGCRWTVPVHGRVGARRYVQLSAVCASSAADAITLMNHLLVREGWKSRPVGAIVLQAEKGSTRLQLVGSDSGTGQGSGGGHSALVLIESRSASRLRP